MNRLELMTTTDGYKTMHGLYRDIERRLASSPPGLCPVDTVQSFVSLCNAQSCGKCVPCRIGLGALSDLLNQILDGKGEKATLKLLQRTAESIVDSADCAIGYDAARMVLDSLYGFADDYHEHINHGQCITSVDVPVPCVSLCPAHVDVPGYVSLVGAGNYQDAVRLIRKDNPFPVTCGYICEHPCEEYCRRGMIDDAINIRGLKRFAVDHAGEVPAPANMPATGKKIAVIGGGPSGLSAAYYLSLMGHEVTIYERRKQLGGMLRYGIPAYRFPRELLDRDIEHILSTGVKAVVEADIGTEIPLDKVLDDNDAVFISVGAHSESKLRIPGEELEGVISAVGLLRGIGDHSLPDFKGKRVVVIGGGNVAMDASRTSLRLGAESVTCVYRRRRGDMTALTEEIEGAIAEGVELLTLQAPAAIESDGRGRAQALLVQPQMPGEFGKDGRPLPIPADLPTERIPADIIICAVGQRIESGIYEKAGIPTDRGMIMAMLNGQIFENGKLFAGGDCATGPATAIKAIAAGKVAAANIDNYLGYHHEIVVDVEIPGAGLPGRERYGRIDTTERGASERKKDFACIENGITEEGAVAEASRCLRCDHFGCGSLRGRRELAW